ncbi:aconitate hydratase AcnA [Celeribacter sp.]|uniref:aconitate hydratase AcnA n=1 Tax=Celeribacter sp. TaxID=1890673 RepID=UPI003A911087
MNRQHTSVYIRNFDLGAGRTGKLYSLPALAKDRCETIARLPVSIRILLESAMRNCGKPGVTPEHVETLINWKPSGERQEVPLSVVRVVLQDFTATPLLCDLAAMRAAMAQAGSDPTLVEPQVPVQLVIDHSVQVNYIGGGNALRQNMELEYARNAERYSFFKWSTSAFEKFTAVPPGFGIIHQVNLETLAKGVFETNEIWHPDTLVGTDSHTTMINGIGILGWGVGGIEAESAMLGQPVTLVAPDVVGVELVGERPEGVTITDAVLAITEILRSHGVVGKFVEFHGAGAAALTATDRATIANMAPEYGATMGFFPTDEQTLAYFQATGRTEEEITALRAYYTAQDMFGMPQIGDIDYSEVLQIDLSMIAPSVAGPKRPQDRINLPNVGSRFEELLKAPVSDGGYALETSTQNTDNATNLSHGDILIAAITSCTNTSNPEVLLTAGLLARNAVAAGLKVPERIKTSFAPGSRVVTEYLHSADLLAPLEQLGFSVVAYGCAVCAGNSGPLAPELDAAIAEHDLVCAAVLSGNRNFEARIHPSLRANLLMSPPLVIAFALAGSIRMDLTTEPLGKSVDGRDIYLSDIWPDPRDIEAAMVHSLAPEAYRKIYGASNQGGELWQNVEKPIGEIFEWPEHSSYLAEPPFFSDFNTDSVESSAINRASILAILGDSITTDHISPAGIIGQDSPAGQWLQEHKVAPADFNTYGARRGHHEVMMRGTFANVRLRNQVAGGREGGFTRIEGLGDPISMYDAAQVYKKMERPLVVIAGREYGCGSSRDWAAKGTKLLGVRTVIAQSFERIHRSNLVGMGVIPCEFLNGENANSLGIIGTDRLSLPDITHPIQPGSTTRLIIEHSNGERLETTVKMRIDSTIEADYIAAGGVGRFILRKLHTAKRNTATK